MADIAPPTALRRLMADCPSPPGATTMPLVVSGWLWAMEEGGPLSPEIG